MVFAPAIAASKMTGAPSSRVARACTHKFQQSRRRLPGDNLTSQSHVESVEDDPTATLSGRRTTCLSDIKFDFTCGAISEKILFMGWGHGNKKRRAMKKVLAVPACGACGTSQWNRPIMHSRKEAAAYCNVPLHLA
jgi:hypothetical protein